MNTATTATLTATRHNGSTVAAAWECWLGASTLACQVTGTAWNWYTSAFFSQAAMRRYQWLGQMIACLGMLAYLAGKLTRLHLQPRIDAFVDSCQAQPGPVAEPAPVQLEPAQVEPERQPEASPEPVTALGIRELRKLGTAQGIKGSARMRKEELLARLAA